MMRQDGTKEKNCFSVIIPAYNAERTLAACLEALTCQSVSGNDYEIILVDDGSTDGTSIIAKNFNVNYVFQTNQGPAAARNRGVRIAAGDIILFTDSDCIPEYNWMEEMVRPFINPAVIGVKGAYKTRQKELAARFVQAEFEDRYRLLQKHSFIDMVDTYSASFKKDVFLKIGGFDVSFPVANNEDTDLSYRLSTAGYGLIFNPKAFVYHIHPNTFIKYLKLKFWRGFWRSVVYRRYPEKALKDSYTPAVIKIQTVLMAFSLVLMPAMVFLPRLTEVILFLWGAIIFSSLPFSLSIFHKDRIVGLISPGVILLRSMVFAVGSVLGILRELSFSLTRSN